MLELTQVPLEHVITMFQNKCQDLGVTTEITSKIRSVEKQAIFWRQSRSRLTIEAKANDLKRNGFGYLADVLLAVGPQNGPQVTTACCGESWHNYGLAFDAVPIVKGSQADDKDETWLLMGIAGEEIGLTWGGRWEGFNDPVHFQIPASGNPLQVYSPELVKKQLEALRERCT